MAIYHFSAQTISRSQGKSAVACASYRAAEKLVDERQGTTHDYTNKQDVLHSEIMLPEKAPQWMGEREKLWNAVEAAEKRKDAQLSREINISLPRELTLEKNKELIKEFVQENFVRHGMIADVCIHEGHAADGQNQPHAHIMLTLREVTQEGFGKKVREWNGKEYLLNWREEWANLTNHYLAKEGLDLRIDHRSFEEQGIDLAPQSKIGPTIARDRMARLEEHQKIAEENGQWILENPTVALDALIKQQSTFTHHDLARFVNRHTKDAEQFSAVYAAVKNHESVVKLGLDEQGRERFSTKEQLELESKMLSNALGLARMMNHAVNSSSLNNIPAKRNLTTEQTAAFEHLLKPSSLSCVVGYAGTGKSYLLGSTREAWQGEGFNVIGMTLSGIAAQNLTSSSGIESRTIASHFYAWDKGNEKLTSRDIIVVDEAGMIGSRQMARILSEATEAKAKVVLIGDPEQLQAIDAGAAFRAIAEQTGYVELTEVRRQQIDWQREATYEFATRQTEKALSRYQDAGLVHCFETSVMARRAIIEKWQENRLEHPSESQIILCDTRRDVRAFNDDIRTFRKAGGELGQAFSLQKPEGALELCIHDKVYFLKNDRLLGVKNGTLGALEKIDGKMLHIRLEGEGVAGNLVVVNAEQYAELTHGYAATIHKGQGVTVDRSYVFASKYMNSHLTHVGMTRHRKHVELFYSKENFANKQSLFSTLSQSRHKDVTVDYLGKTKSNHEETKQPLEKQFDKHQIERYEALFRQTLKSVDSTNSIQNKPSQRDELQAFKAQFEAQNPEKARAMQDSLVPRHERLAKEVEKQIKAFEEMVNVHVPSFADKKQLEKYIAGIVKQEDVMSYLKQHNKALSQKIEGFKKSFGLGYEKDMGERSL